VPWHRINLEQTEFIIIQPESLTMSRISICYLIVLCAIATHVEAHARLVSSQPANGATVAAAPASVTLVFSESAKVTALSIQSAVDKSPKKLAVATAEDSVSHGIALPALAAGDYTLTWHALSDDGHVTSGTVKFSVRGEATGTPNT
jgi:methionine-rich copper-binding protein CopC